MTLNLARPIEGQQWVTPYGLSTQKGEVLIEISFFDKLELLFSSHMKFVLDKAKYTR